MNKSLSRTHQCEACPWRMDTDPHVDIPGGYDPEKHRNLKVCSGGFSGHIMACHESPRPGGEFACVGWLHWAVNQGNSIPMRMAAMRGEFNPRKLKLRGEQYETLEDMLATADNES